MRPEQNGNTELIKKLGERLASHDRQGAVDDALEAIVSKSIGLEDLYVQVLSPLMTETGAKWQTGSIQIWEEHLATTTIRTIIEALYPEVMKLKVERANKASVLLACPREEQHDIGLRMISDLFELSGWIPYLLGADSPDDQVISAARALQVVAIVLSASTHWHCLHLRRLANQIEKEMPDIKIWVTGSVFRDDRHGWDPTQLLNPASVTSILGKGDYA